MLSTNLIIDVLEKIEQKDINIEYFQEQVLIIDNEQQRVDGYAQIDRHSDEENFMFSISDISTVYNGQLKIELTGVHIVVTNVEMNLLGTIIKWQINCQAKYYQAVGDRFTNIIMTQIDHIRIHGKCWV